jgi:hypothetical protein
MVKIEISSIIRDSILSSKFNPPIPNDNRPHHKKHMALFVWQATRYPCAEGRITNPYSQSKLADPSLAV